MTGCITRYSNYAYNNTISFYLTSIRELGFYKCVQQTSIGLLLAVLIREMGSSINSGVRRTPLLVTTLAHSDVAVFHSFKPKVGKTFMNSNE